MNFKELGDFLKGFNGTMVGVCINLIWIFGTLKFIWWCLE